MATRRSTKIEMPIPIGDLANPTTQTTTTIATIDAPPPGDNPWLPTLLETLLISIYPATLLLGSVFSFLHPNTRQSTYLPSTQAYDVNTAPSYFAKKSNAFNVYFVKIGWIWITSAFSLLVFTHSSFGPPFNPSVVTRRRLQAVLRYGVVTMVWLFVTQWFFGPPIIDRSFRWTGGKCAPISATSLDSMLEEADDAGEKMEAMFTHTACKAVGGQWKGGHDISGHVFLLILGSAMLWLETLPAFLNIQGLHEARRIRTADGLIRSAAVEKREESGAEEAEKRRPKKEKTSVGEKAVLIVGSLSWWMLLMTAAYFHTWFEKFTGLSVAFGAIYVVYFLPRAVPAWRQVVGLPGV